MMTNERFEELVHNLLAYDEARNILKLSDVERDEFQNAIESRLHPTKLEMETPRGKLVLEKDEDTPNIYTGALKVMAVENLLMRTGKEKKLEKTFPHDEERVDD